MRRVRHTTRAASPEDFYDTFTAQFRDVEVRAGWWTAGAGWAAAPEGEEGPPGKPPPAFPLSLEDQQCPLWQHGNKLIFPYQKPPLTDFYTTIF